MGIDLWCVCVVLFSSLDFVQFCFKEFHLVCNLVRVGGISVFEVVECFLYIFNIRGFELAHDSYFFCHLYAFDITFPSHGGVVVRVDDVCVARREESIATIVEGVFSPVHP